MSSATKTLSRRELRSFGLTVAAALPIFFGLLLPFLRGRHYPDWPWLVAIPLAVVAFLSPQLLRVAHVPWMKLGEILGFINTRLILGIVYLVVVIPVGLVRGWFGSDPLTRKWDKSSKTYRVTRESAGAPEHMERPY